MKILMLTPYLPYPPASGGQIRTLNLLKYLSKNNEIVLICLYKNEKEKKYASYLETFCKKIYLCKRPEKPWQPTIILRAIFSPLPFLIVRNYSDDARKTVEKLLKNERFDVIHAETFYIMPHIHATAVPILLVEQTIEYKVYQHFTNSFPFFIRPFFYLDILKLRSWERHYWKKASLVATVSEADTRIISAIEPSIRSVVIPNGAGDEMFIKKINNKKISTPKILFMGNFFWLQNIEAAKYLIHHIFPHLLRLIPDIQVVIAGQEARRKLALPLDPHIEIIDIDPDDTPMVKKIYHDSTLFIAPIFGPGGTRLKILAAMAAGIPVVATKVGIEGLGVINGEHVVIANSPAEFANAVKTILSDHSFYNTLRRKAHALVRQKFSWMAIARQLEVVYKNITKKR
ncbi:glycosyltransferase family 4 protein [Candidatus Roizmanbacteria bacterium]|nr:glycosyltransferase family 4 protein [Candidatus Roizmanbacteria bacterium]